MKKTLLFILVFLPLMMTAQHFRDNFLGTYTCSVYQSGIQIQLTDTFHNSTREFILFPDSSFENENFPTIINGRFYDTDSIFVYYNHLSPVSDYYYGKKIDVGVNEINFNSIQIYPNPAQNKFFINEAIKFKQVEIYNVTGSLLLSKELKDQELIEIDALKFESGIYFVKCSTEKHSFVKKIIIN